MSRLRLVASLIACLLIAPHVAFSACDLNATTSNFSSQLAAAQPGQTLCLASGNYGSFSGVSKSSPGVTITAASGATPSMSIAFRQTSPVAQWLILDSLTITGGDISAPANNITIQNSTITDKVNIWQNANNSACSNCGAMNNQNIVFNNDMLNMSSNQSGSGGYEARINFVNAGNNDPTPAGVTVKNSKFTTGCADGVDFLSGGYGVTIGPGNEFFNLQQGSCGPHVDPIQFVGSDSPGPTITGNYFHDNSTGIAAYDYANSGLINNNVVVRTTQDYIEIAGFDSASVIEHNTVVGGDINCDKTHEGNLCTAVIRNNIVGSIVLTTSGGTGNPSFNDYNLCTSGTCAGAHSLKGSPTYVGGTSPSNYAGYALANTSLGFGAGNDGSSMGIVVTTNGSAPNPPTGLTAMVN